MAGYDEPTEAARAFGWNISTYLSHENGTRGLRPPVAERYAKAFRVPAEWLLYARGRGKAVAAEPPRTVPLVGYVAAGAEAYFDTGAQGEFGRIQAPAGSTDETVAVEIRGDSLGSFFDRWLVFYDDVRRPITADLVGKLCIVGLADGRVMIKKVQRSKARGLFHLISQTADAPILDVAIEWAARVRNMAPR